MRHEQNKQGENIDMNFEVFVEIYLEEVRTKIKLKSFVNKKSIMEKHILPYFEGKNMREITPEEIEKWQNKMAETIDPKTGRAYTKSYIKTMHGHMRAIMNYYKFSESPSEPEATGEKWIMAWDDELEIWKPDRYMRFAEAMMEKPLFFYVFEILYWCGLRDGEILALAPDDIDFEKKEISISKTFQSLNEKEYIMSCKSMGNKRTVSMPDFVCNEMKDYMDYIYKTEVNGRLFPISKNELIYALKKGSAKAGLPEIETDGLRNSHISLLLVQGFSPDAVAERTGVGFNGCIKPGDNNNRFLQEEIADKLNSIKKGWLEYEE